MGKQIDLGSFQWDTNKLEHQIAANIIEQQKFAAMTKSAKDEIKEESKAIAELEKKIESERKAQERMTAQLAAGNRTQESYNSEIAKSNQLIDQYVDEQIAASKAQADHIIIQNRSEQATKDLRLENNELNKYLAAGRTELSQNEGAYRELNKELNAAKLEAKNLGIELYNLEVATGKDTDEYRKLNAEFAAASKKADDLNTVFKGVDKTVGDNSRTVGDYKDQIVGAFSEITIGAKQMASGDIAGGFETIKGGLSGIKDSANGLFKALTANPLTAILIAVAAVATGIALGVKEIFDYNKSIQENVILTNNLFNNLGDKSSEYLDRVRNNLTGISKTFDIEFKTLANTVDKLLDTGAVKTEFEALELIKNGLLTAPDKDEFISKLETAAEKARLTGLNIKEVIALNRALEDSPVDPEAIYGALDKATKNLTEQSDKTAAGLSYSLGAAFSTDLLSKIDTGKITVTEALVEIDKQAKKSGLSVADSANLGATLFGKSAVAAGGLENVLGLVNQAYEKQTVALTPLQKATQDLTEANIDLATAKDEALKSDSVITFQKNLELLWVKAQIVWYGIVDAVIDAIKWVDEITGSSETLGETWDVVAEYASSLWKLITDLADIFGDLFKALGFNTEGTKSLTKSFFQAINPLNILKALFGALTIAVKSFSNFIEQNRINISAFAITVKSVFAQIVDAAKSFMNLDFEGGLNKLKNINISKEFAAARKEAEKIVAMNKQAKKDSEKEETVKPDDSVIKKTKAEKDAEAKATEEAAKKAAADAKSAQTKRIADAKKAAEAAIKLRDEEAKRSIELLKQEADQKTEIAKTELAEYISMNADKFADDKRLTASKLALQLQYLDEVKKQQAEINALEQKAKTDAVNLKIQEIDEKVKAGKSLTVNDITEKKLLNEQLGIIVKEFQQKDLDLEIDTLKKKKEATTDNENKILEQKKLSQAIAFQQKLLDLESQGASEFEIAKEQEKQRFQNELETWAEQNEIKFDLDEEKYISDTEILAERKALEDQIVIQTDEKEKERLQNKLNGMAAIQQGYEMNQRKLHQEVELAKWEATASLFGGIADLLGENTRAGKAAAIAQVQMSTGIAIARVWEAKDTLPAPFNTVIKIAQTAVAVGNMMGAMKRITSTKAADGMLIGPSHANGGIPISTPNGMIEAEGGEVIINKNSSLLFRNELSAINEAGGGVRFAGGGIFDTPSSNLSTVQNAISVSATTEISDAAIERIYNAVLQGTHSGSQSGISDLSDNRKIANGANF